MSHTNLPQLWDASTITRDKAVLSRPGRRFHVHAATGRRTAVHTTQQGGRHWKAVPGLCWTPPYLPFPWLI